MTSEPTADLGPVERARREAADVAIVGGGFAGSLAAIVLGGAGHKVMLIERAEASANVFRAEKFAGDQLELLGELDLRDAFKAASTQANSFINIRGRLIVDRLESEQYNMPYAKMVEALRARIPLNVAFKRGRVENIETSEDIQRITLANGETIPARLVVLATGVGDALRRQLGVERVRAHPQPTISAGFSILPPTGGFRFPALTAYGEAQGDSIDYLSLFPIGATMRGNLFMFSQIDDPRLLALKERGMEALFALLPGLRPWLHDCQWMGDVALFPVELYKCVNVVREGVVLIGDSFRTSCPAVGTGLSCAMVDVLRLRDHVAEWLATPGMGREKIAGFYDDPIKRARDESTHERAFRRRDAVNTVSRAHKLYRAAHFAKRGLRDRLGLGA